MKIIKLKPTSNSLRHHVKLSKFFLIKNNKIVKNIFTKKVSRCGKKKHAGVITAWHKQKGAKKLYINLGFSSLSNNSIVIGVMHDPNRTGLVSLNFDLKNKTFFSSLCTSGIYPGFLIKSDLNIVELKLGFRTKLKTIPTGSMIHSIGKSSKISSSVYARAAGAFGQLIQIDKKYAKIKLPSNKFLIESVNSYASLGSVSNKKHNLICLGKAGRSRKLGRRPIVRGIAMNPVDHPHGGRTNGGRPSVTPWGLPTKCKFYLKKKYVKV